MTPRSAADVERRFYISLGNVDVSRRLTPRAGLYNVPLPAFITTAPRSIKTAVHPTGNSSHYVARGTAELRDSVLLFESLNSSIFRPAGSRLNHLYTQAKTREIHLPLNGELPMPTSNTTISLFNTISTGGVKRHL